ncbi:MAG: hypothetical protein ACM3TT_02315 [Syntrophothermus sp.]
MRKPVDHLLERACPSIKYRVRLEVLGEPGSTEEMICLQEQILQDETVKEIIGSQQAGGWLGTRFHTAEKAENGKYNTAAEVGIRLLCEKGVTRNHPVLVRALEALDGTDETFARELFRVGRILDQKGLGGSYLIRAAVFARAGVEGQPLVKEQIDTALEAFRAVFDAKSIWDIAEKYREKLVFKPEVRWPNIYHLRLLAFTSRWRTPENREMVGREIGHLVKVLPLPEIHVREKAQLIAPCGPLLEDFDPDMSKLDAKGWMAWFRRMELLSRLGVVGRVPELRTQVKRLEEMLEANGGQFTQKMAHSHFTHWTAYTGLALEKDWKSPERRVFDLTFRSLLVLYYAGFFF